MIEFIFTLDYEVYGDGRGSLQELVYESANRLVSIFKSYGTRFVAFIEMAELEVLASANTDSGISAVLRHVRDLQSDGFELGLHLHPQWYNARYDGRRWCLDAREYNLCILPRERIEEIVDRSLSFFRFVTDVPDFTPLSFRAGNWLFQPTRTAAEVLAERGIKIDSSVFKGGLLHQHALDYRRALRNGYFWTFFDRVDSADADGPLLELPIYTRMVPFWNMLTNKRIGISRRGPAKEPAVGDRLSRLRDFCRPMYPQKLDFCRMTMDELSKTLEHIIEEDRREGNSYKPVVAIGHTKDLVDFSTLDALFSYLGEKGIAITTLSAAYEKCTKEIL